MQERYGTVLPIGVGLYEKTPAADPAQEQFKNEGKEGNADGLVIRDKGLARLARINR